MTSGQFEPSFFLNNLKAHYLSYRAEFPQGNPGAWYVNFDPQIVYQNTPTDLLVTNATISLSAPPSPTNPIQSAIIRINISNVWVAGNFWLAGNQPGFESVFSKIFWLLGAITAGYGSLSGKIITEYINVDVLVKVKPYHSIKIQALSPDTIGPNQIATIPILVQNLGNYNDTFNFRFKTETGYPLSITNNNSITLKPGEQGQALIGVASPPNALDTGTLHSIIMEAYSIDEPNITIATQQIPLETQGLYVSQQNTAASAAIGFFILLGIALFIYWRRRVRQNVSIPPEKPWKIPEEQLHLAELKRTDIKAYEQERIMMEDEYKSALYWYDDYKKSLRKKSKEKKPKKKQKEKPVKAPKDKPKKPFSTFFKKAEQLPKVEEKKVQPIIPAEDKTKEKALIKIKAEQDRQLKRIK
jgi:hypothetical protein